MSGVPVLNKRRAGQVNTLEPEGAAEITIAIRKAAAKGMERSPVSDGNVESNEEGSAPASVGKTNPPSPAKSAADNNKATPERTPPYAKDPISGDGWQRARQQAKTMLRKK